MKQGDQYYLEAEGGHTEYTWSTGAMTPSIPITDTGEYWVYVPYGMGYISSEHIRVTDLLNPCLFTSQDSDIRPQMISMNCVFAPSDHRIRIFLSLPEQAVISVRILEMTGALLKVEPSLQHPSGTMEIDIDASSIKPGIYVLTVNVNDDRITQKIIIH